MVRGVCVVAVLAIGFLSVWHRHPIYGITLHIVRSGAQSSLFSPGMAVVGHPSPTYAPRDLVVIRPFTKHGEPYFGRVVSQSAEQYQVIGMPTGNPNGRVWLHGSALQKVAIIVPGAGYVLGWVLTPGGFLSVAFLGVILIFMPLLYQSFKQHT